jgi:hypothetical protein
MDKEKDKKDFSHLDDRLKINSSFEEAIKVLVQTQPKETKNTDKQSQKNR